MSRTRQSHLKPEPSASPPKKGKARNRGREGSECRTGFDIGPTPWSARRRLWDKQIEEGGGYGHPDHIAVHTYTTQAFEAAGDPSKYPEQRIAGLALHTPERLYYSAIPRGRVQRLMERYSHLFPPTEGGIDPNAFGVPDDRITTELDVSGVLDRRLRAIQAHQTQLTPDNPFHLLPAEVIREFLAREFFIRARPPVSGSIREHDLFP